MKIEQLGPYRLGRMLGRGGMGSVYEAVHVETQEPAAVKILAMQLADAEGFRERFESEIETLRKLRHPNIVRILGHGEQDGMRYYAMELVHGASLEEEIRAGRRFTWREVTQIAVQTCRALKHAHDHGVIHRDIKPANLLLSAEGELKLSDFGIAKFFGASNMTATGGVVGTAEYMAPEQADGRPVTARSDLYSLGGVLYALLARRPPFVARTILEMLNMHRHVEPEPVRRFNPDVPEELEGILKELLIKDPNRRIRSAMLLSKRLESMEHGLNQREQRLRDAKSDVTMVDGARPPGDSPGAVGATQPGTAVMPRRGPEEPQGGLAQTVVTAASEGVRPSAIRAPIEESPAEVQESIAHFTRVEEERSAAPRESFLRWTNPDGTFLSPATVIPLVVLVLLSLGIWWWWQPPSADALYERVSSRAAADGTEALVEVESDIDEFLYHYPGDARIREIEGYREDLNLFRLERRLERMARRGSRGDLTPAELAYAEAIRQAETDPLQAMARLQGLINLYDDESDGSAAIRRCMALARRRLIRLQQQSQTQSETHRASLTNRIDHAVRIAAEDPDKARRICQGAIDLFADRLWAREEIARARELLTQLPAENARAKGDELDLDEQNSGADDPPAAEVVEGSLPVER